MKKVLIFLAVLGFVVSGLYAQEKYTVETITGRVERELSPGKWAEIKQGESLGENVVVRTGINSTLVLKSASGTTVIKALQTGEAAVLAGSTAAGGIRLSGRAAETDTSAVERSTAKASTASARASNEAEEIWAEE